MAYMALYREWRPRTFTEVVGQQHVVRTLVNALNKQRLSHAYLFCGPRGTGKTSIAKILAKAVNCLDSVEGNPCGQCPLCLEIESGSCMDVVEIDAASNRGIDEVRELREKVRFAPSSGKTRVFIIDEVHMLTNEAFNALLKTLEEPPAHAMFILATTEPHRIPLTILSRCQRFDFHRIGEPEMLERLRAVAEASGIGIESEALDLIVKAAEGAMRDGLSILDQAAAYGGDRIGADEIHSILGTIQGDLLQKASQWLFEGRAGEVLELVGETADQGRDLRVFLKELNAHLRGVLLELLGAESSGEKVDRLSLVLQRLATTEQEMRWSSQPRVLLEVAMVRAARLFARDTGLGSDRFEKLAEKLMDMEDRIRSLEKKPQAAAHFTRAETGQQAVYERIPMETDYGKEKRQAPDIEKINTTLKQQEPAKPLRKKKEPENAVENNGSIQETTREKAVEEQDDQSKTMPTELVVPELLTKINSRWNNILDVARKACPHIASHLTQGKGWPLTLEGNTLTIGFPKTESYAPLAVGILGSEANCRELSGLIQSVCQVDLRVRLVTSEKKPPRRASPPKKAVQPEDIEALFGEGEEIPADTFEGFDD